MIGLKDMKELMKNKSNLRYFWRDKHKVNGLECKQNKDSEMHEQHT